MSQYRLAEPLVVLTGCRPWPPGRTKFAAPQSCPVCRGATADDESHVYCCWCDAMSPPLARLAAMAGRGRLNAEAADSRQADRDAERDLARKMGKVLSERDRRRVWNGYKGPFDRSQIEPSNLARVGREWLIKIGQVPDFSLKLDRHGNVVGQVGPDDWTEAIAS